MLRTTFLPNPQVYSVLAQLLALPLAEADAELIKGLKGEEFRARFFAIVEQRLLSLAETTTPGFSDRRPALGGRKFDRLISLYSAPNKTDALDFYWP